MFKIIFSTVAVLALGYSAANAQSFTLIDSLPVGAYGTAAWGDYDNDGRKDLAYISQAMVIDSPDVFRVYHNTDAGFVPVVSFPMLFNSSVVWADMNDDGFEDMVASGLEMPGSRLNIYISNGDGTFDVIDTLPGLSIGSVAVADYNGDGLPDIAACGYTDTVSVVGILLKNEGDLHFTLANKNFPAIAGGEVKWCDYDHDGKPDLAWTGFVGATSRSYLYHNEGADSFSLAADNMAGGMGTLDWADFNGDGWEDILVSGVDSTGAHNYTELYFNNTDGTFTQQTHNLEVFGEPVAADVADFNNDGKPDIFFAGGNPTYPENFSALSINVSGTNFSHTSTIKSDIVNCIVAAADIDIDGDQDLLVSNYIWRNDGSVSAVHTPKQLNIRLYPNPAKEQIIIEAATDNLQLTIFDIGGKSLYHQRLTSGSNEINTSNFAAGNYIVQLKQGDKLAIEKLVIE